MCKMGKTKQGKEKKFDRNVEISAPILDPEIIKAIHSPPKGQRIDIKHGGFKALLSDLNSQDSTDELTPLNDNHIPSYIGISCAVSGYSNYSSYTKRSSSPSSDGQQHPILKTTIKSSNAAKFIPNRSRATSPTMRPHPQEVHHITIDKNNIHSADEERKELTEKLTASATERRRSPSPITPTEDDRHHGAYVGARYCPLPPPSKLVNKHIPLLGIDDDKDPDQFVEDAENKVEQKIASLYGDNFVEDWRESMTHKIKKEHSDEPATDATSSLKSPKDLVTLKPTPLQEVTTTVEQKTIDVPAPNAKVLANVEKEFLNKLLTDENPPMPKSPSPIASPVHAIQTTVTKKTVASTAGTNFESFSPPRTPTNELRQEFSRQPSQPSSPVRQIQAESPSPVASPSPQPQEAPMSPDSGKSQSFLEEELNIPQLSQVESREEHIEYEIRAQSPLDNQSSPVKLQTEQHSPDLMGEEILTLQQDLEEKLVVHQEREENLVNFSPEPVSEPQTEIINPIELETHEDDHERDSEESSTVAEQELHSMLPEVTRPAEAEMINLMDDTIVVGEDSKLKTEEAEEQDDAVCETKSPETVTEEAPASEKPASGDNDGRYYLGLLEQEKSFILEQIVRAENALKEKETRLDEDTLGRIHSAIGKANLLINKKCKQFEDLCESNKKSNSSNSEEEQFPVLNDDLAGFWDMLNIQIMDVKRSFEGLWKEGL